MSHIINEYKFGHIIIDSKKYSSDLKIFPDKIEAKWMRAKGHSLSISDIDDLLSFSPNILIIGTGSYGMMQVPESIKIKIQGFVKELIIEKTGDACMIYNKLMKSQNTNDIFAALHLTC